MGFRVRVSRCLIAVLFERFPRRPPIISRDVSLSDGRITDGLLLLQSGVERFDCDWAKVFWREKLHNGTLASLGKIWFQINASRCHSAVMFERFLSEKTPLMSRDVSLSTSVEPDELMLIGQRFSDGRTFWHLLA